MNLTVKEFSVELIYSADGINTMSGARSAIYRAAKRGVIELIRPPARGRVFIAKEELAKFLADRNLD